MTLTRPAAVEDAPATFAEAAERHLDDVFGYLLYLTHDRSLADDLAGSTFEKAFRLWPRFDARRGTARTWLIGIARTTALDWFRAESRRKRREEAGRRSPRHTRPTSSRGSRRRCTTRSARSVRPTGR